jgi:hypothetical protein
LTVPGTGRSNRGLSPRFLPSHQAHEDWPSWLTIETGWVPGAVPGSTPPTPALPCSFFPSQLLSHRKVALTVGCIVLL